MPKKEPKEWTIIVYLSGDNNLAEETVFALKEMYRIGTTRDFNVVVLHDVGGNHYTFDVPEAKMRPVEVAKVEGSAAEAASVANGVTEKKSTVSERLNFNLLEIRQPFPERSESSAQPKGEPIPQAKTQPSPQTQPQKTKAQLTADLLRDATLGDLLTQFLRKTIEDNPASHYMLVLSGHGAGALGHFLPSVRPSVRLTIPGMRLMFNALKKALGEDYKGFDILGLDSCLMSMAEVAFELQDHVGLMIGNEGFEPNTGWYYAAVMQTFHDHAHDGGPEKIARELVNRYIQYYSDYAHGDVSIDQSVLDLRKNGDQTLRKNSDDKTKLEPIRQALNELCVALIDGVKDPKSRVARAIVHAHWRAQSYKFEQYTDLWDFCRCLKEDPDIEKTSLAELCDNVQVTIETDRCVLVSGYVGPGFQHSHGVSIFFPWADIKDPDNTTDRKRYQDLRFAQRSRWDGFIAEYLVATREKEREGTGPLLPSELNRRSVALGGGKVGLPESDRVGLPESDRVGLPESDRVGLPESDRGALAANITANVGHSKNPPVKWKKSRLP